jgi:hypothetical protein
VLCRLDRLFLAQQIERELAGVVLLEPVMHERVIDAHLRGEALQAALAGEVRLYEP